MTSLDKWNDRYKKNWCVKEQLKRLVQLGQLGVVGGLTENEYKTITGESYVQ